jgi:hypothetical protein
MDFIVFLVDVAGYYLSFLGSVPLTECGRTLRRTLHPLFYGGKLSAFSPIYDVMGRVLAMFCMNYLFIGFIVRDIGSTFAVWRSVYFIGHLIIVLPLLLLDVFGLGKVVKKAFHPKVKAQ